MDDNKIITDAFDDLMNSLQVETTEENRQLIIKAFEFANKAHAGARRRSGEPYIIHPIAVAKIVATEIGLGTTSVISALLHDVVEDTEYSIDDIKELFGYKVAEIVDGLTKIKGTWNVSGSSQAESFRKVFMTLRQDVRVILIKMGDRLHNMRTLASMPEHKRVKIASETLYIYAPLAHRMGFYAIKSELEDLSLLYEHPDEYNSIIKKIEAFYNLHKEEFDNFIQVVSSKLKESNCQYTVKLISRGAYSAWNKMQVRNENFDDIQDLFAVRVVFEPKLELSEKMQCWNIYSLITDLFQPRPNSLRDMVSTPQVNGYEAIHMTVMSNFGQWVDMQIRSQRMDEVGERGWAMYRKYKQQGDINEFDKWLQSIKDMLMKQQSDAVEFVDEFKLNLFAKEIRIFTPSGEMRTLPKGATVLDFAYDIHTEVGNTCIGAKVNRKLVTMKCQLQTGDQVEILTNSRQKPQKEWMEYVMTAKAKTTIGNYFRRERKELIRNGMSKFEAIAEYLNVENEWEILNKLIQKRGLPNKDELFIQLGMGLISQNDVQQIILAKPAKQNRAKKFWMLQLFGDKSEEPESKHDSVVTNSDGEIIVSPCCNPIPGDDVVGLEMGGKVMVHKRKCPEAIRLMANYGDKIVSVQWTEMQSFLTSLAINGIDRVGIVSDIAQVITKEKRIAALRLIHFESNNGIFTGYIHVYVHNKAELDRLIAKLSDVMGVEKVIREEN